MKNVIYILALALFANVGVFRVHAEEPSSSSVATISGSLKEATTQVEQSNADLTNIKDSAASPEDELAARKKVVNDAIALSKQEVENLKANLAKLPEFDEESKESELKASFLNHLGYYGAYYEAQLKLLEPISDIEGIKKLAKDIVDFRTVNYNPMVERITDFLLLFYTENAVDTANTRFFKIGSDIKKLEKLSFIKPDSFKKQLDKVGEMLKDATSNYLSAKAEILGTKMASEGEIPEGELKITPRQLLEKSLIAIKDSYDAFIQISKDIRKAAGLR